MDLVEVFGRNAGEKLQSGWVILSQGVPQKPSNCTHTHLLGII